MTFDILQILTMPAWHVDDHIVWGLVSRIMLSCDHDLWWPGNNPKPEWPLSIVIHYHRADSRFVPSQWEAALQSNAVSHWLGASLESALLSHWGVNRMVKILLTAFSSLDHDLWWRWGSPKSDWLLCIIVMIQCGLRIGRNFSVKRWH